MAELWHLLWSSFAGFTSAAFEQWPMEFPCFKGNSWMLPALPAGSNAATKHEEPPCSQDFQYQSPSPCLGAVLNHSWSRSGKRFHFQHLYPSGMHSQWFFFLVEYIQWFQVIVDRSCLHAGRVQDLLDRATGQVLREGLREKIHSGKPTADIPTFNIRCNKLIHCNFYSFSRK